uniref:Uncharacterized protein n=1 Tax=Kalanchoe fedtschenkoi TaxID=63787 RepID=A0A7N0TVV6_KALFE
MEWLGDSESQVMVGHTMEEVSEINPKRARFPCCIVWTPIPVLSWLIPFIGHIGICREDGVILDFAGPNFVCVDNFTFGAVARYIQISKKQCSRLLQDATCRSVDERQQDERNVVTWDDAIRKSTQEYQHNSYNLLTCNCHSFVANNLNKLGFGKGEWNVVNLATLIFLKGCWVDRTAMVRSFLPFILVFSIGIIVGGKTFLTCVAFSTLALLGWFIIGTYCFKGFIQL